MKNIKKLFRLLFLGALLLLALLGIGMGGVGPILSANRERYAENGIKTAWVKNGEEEENAEEEKDRP
ncbi:hypothetical protein LX87_03780 [Larkinella arboricola]|uniref:Uncharacterized protein n=1 Tax=Larkinella arboricola TaxID=643671 RepID=A0A327WUC0_LARAB|nr:hypothetical protein [Larkinella arboricola]RAJ96030.1 hypothetical protein LX87_03780 [Larkinella arboricola]